MTCAKIVLSLGEDATEEDGALIASLFGAVGKIWRADEKLFDAITGLRFVASVTLVLLKNHANYYPITKISL